MESENRNIFDFHCTVYLKLFFRVKYAIDTETNEAVAIKILDKEKIQKQNMGNQIKKEISIMKMVKHKYIVGMIEVLASKTKIFIVLELITGGELFDKIVQVGKLSDDQARFYFQQLVEGVEYCHKLGVCHRDLKPEVFRVLFFNYVFHVFSSFFQNLLLDEHGNLKISDFGLSSLYIGDAEGTEGTTRTELLHTTCGTPNYVAPEVLSDQGYDGKKADVWSCGVILYVLLAGFLPFDESTIVQLFAKIQNADFTYPSWFSPDLRSLLNQMLVADPKTRITLSQLKTHPWYIGNGPIATSDGESGQEQVSVPTDAQLEAAVQSVSNAVSSEPLSSSPTQDLEEENDQDDYPRGLTQPTNLNAFDLVSQCGGFMLDRMFSPEIFYTTASSAQDESMTKSTVEGAGKNGSTLFGSSHISSKCYHFTSTNISVEDLSLAVYDALSAMGFDFESSRDAVKQCGVIRTSLLSAKGMVGMFIQVFTLSPSLALLEIKKGKGDILEWNTACSELVDKRIAHLINKPLKSD